jgi:hypothetical protein
MRLFSNRGESMEQYKKDFFWWNFNEQWLDSAYWWADPATDLDLHCVLLMGC